MDSFIIVKVTLILLTALFLWGIYKSGAISFHMSIEHSDEEELRPEVLAFARLMEQRLRDKDADKGQSWKGKSLFGLSTSALAKASFLQTTAICIEASDEGIRHAVDVANYCMMFADVAGALEVPAQESAA